MLVSASACPSRAGRLHEEHLSWWTGQVGFRGLERHQHKISGYLQNGGMLVCYALGQAGLSLAQAARLPRAAEVLHRVSQLSRPFHRCGTTPSRNDARLCVTVLSMFDPACVTHFATVVGTASCLFAALNDPVLIVLRWPGSVTSRTRVCPSTVDREAHRYSYAILYGSEVKPDTGVGDY